MPPEILPPDGFAQFKMWMRDVDRQLLALATARRLEHSSLMNGSLDVLETDGARLASFGLQPDDRSALVFFDTDGSELIRIGRLPDDSHGLAVYDPDGNEQVRLGRLPSGGYGLSILGNAIDEIATEQAATANMPSMGDLATVGPQVSVETGTRALVLYSAICDTLTNGATGSMSYAVTGATSSGAALSGQRFGQFGVDGQGTGTIARIAYEDNLTPGVNVFTLKYARNTSGADVRFRSRSLVVIPI